MHFSAENGSRRAPRIAFWLLSRSPVWGGPWPRDPARPRGPVTLPCPEVATQRGPVGGSFQLGRLSELGTCFWRTEFVSDVFASCVYRVGLRS